MNVFSFLLSSRPFAAAEVSHFSPPLYKNTQCFFYFFDAYFYLSLLMALVRQYFGPHVECSSEHLTKGTTSFYLQTFYGAMREQITAGHKTVC